jgi:hypothetical protein
MRTARWGCAASCTTHRTGARLMRTGASPTVVRCAWCAAIAVAEQALGDVASATDEPCGQGVVKGQKGHHGPRRTDRGQGVIAQGGVRLARVRGTDEQPPCLAAEPVAHDGALHTAPPPGPCRPRTAGSGGQAPVSSCRRRLRSPCRSHFCARRPRILHFPCSPRLFGGRTGLSRPSSLSLYLSWLSVVGEIIGFGGPDPSAAGGRRPAGGRTRTVGGRG